MTITLTREEAQQVLDALEKLANETPTTHVRVGKAISEGKEHVALWFDDSTDPLQQALYLNATKPEKLKPLLTFFRTRLIAPDVMINGLTEQETAETMSVKGLAQPEPEPVAYFDPQERGFYWAKPTKIDAPVTVKVDPIALYTALPQTEPEPVASKKEFVVPPIDGDTTPWARSDEGW